VSPGSSHQLKDRHRPAVTDITDKLKSMSISVQRIRRNEIARSAPSPPTTTPKSGRLLADAMDKVGKDGVITVDEGKRPGHRGRNGSKACSSIRLPSPLLRHRPDQDG